MKRMKKDELLELIKTLKIDKEEFWVLSSGALVLRGIYPDAGDLDIAVTNKGLDELKNNYSLEPKGKDWYKVMIGLNVCVTVIRKSLNIILKK